MLAFSRSRHALEYIDTQDHGNAAPVGEIAEYIAAEESDCLIEAVTSGQRIRVHISLVQQHYSTLEKAGLVEYDDRKELEPTVECERL